MAGQIVGIGVDLVDVKRLEARLRRSQGLAASVFTKGERAYGDKHRLPAKHYAVCFAAKEAFLKAVGLGLWGGVPLTEVEVVRARSGEPSLRLGPKARLALARRKARRALVSLTHEGNAAFAVVLVQ